MRILVFISMIISSLSLKAEITLDNSFRGGLPYTLSPSEISGQFNYRIDPSAGIQKGSNLFHSFQTFNIGKNESVQFLNGIDTQNIIARVTGKSSSTIDGKLIVNSPDTNLYLLNPNGITFGSDSEVNISGSLYATTANSLYLDGGGEFHADISTSSILTTAEPHEFGFLDNITSTIKAENAKIQVSNSESINLFGGHLDIKGGSMYAPDGKVNLISIESQGTIQRTTPLLSINAQQYGNITFNSKDYGNKFADGKKLATVDVTGESMDGEIFIRSENFILTESIITTGNHKSNKMGGDGITIHSEQKITVNGDYDIDKPLLVAPQGIKLTANQISINEAQVSSYSVKFNTGDITLNASDFIEILDGSELVSQSVDGSSGNILLNADNSIELSSSYQTQNETIIIPKAKLTSSTGVDNLPGNISLNTKSLYIENAELSSSVGNYNDNDNIVKKSNININADTIKLNNTNILVESFNSNNLVRGINIFGKHKISIYGESKISTESSGGTGGNITFISKQFEVENSDITASSFKNQGGNIDIKANAIQISNNANYIIGAESIGNEENDNGGNLTITDFKLFNLVSGELRASAEVGHGGNISIEGENFIQSENGDAALNASSELGIDGDVNMDSQQFTLSGIYELEDEPIKINIDIDKCEGTFHIKNKEFLPTPHIFHTPPLL